MCVCVFFIQYHPLSVPPKIRKEKKGGIARVLTSKENLELLETKEREKREKEERVDLFINYVSVDVLVWSAFLHAI